MITKFVRFIIISFIFSFPLAAMQQAFKEKIATAQINQQVLQKIFPNAQSVTPSLAQSQRSWADKQIQFYHAINALQKQPNQSATFSSVKTITTTPSNISHAVAQTSTATTAATTSTQTSADSHAQSTKMTTATCSSAENKKEKEQTGTSALATIAGLAKEVIAANVINGMNVNTGLPAICGANISFRAQGIDFADDRAPRNIHASFRCGQTGTYNQQAQRQGNNAPANPVQSIMVNCATEYNTCKTQLQQGNPNKTILIESYPKLVATISELRVYADLIEDKKLADYALAQANELQQLTKSIDQVLGNVDDFATSFIQPEAVPCTQKEQAQRYQDQTHLEQLVIEKKELLDRTVLALRNAQIQKIKYEQVWERSWLNPFNLKVSDTIDFWHKGINQASIANRVETANKNVEHAVLELNKVREQYKTITRELIANDHCFKSRLRDLDSNILTHELHALKLAKSESNLSPALQKVCAIREHIIKEIIKERLASTNYFKQLHEAQDSMMQNLSTLTQVQQDRIFAIDKTLQQKGALHTVHITLNAESFDYLKQLGVDLHDFGTFEVNAFQEQLIKEGAEIITYCAQKQDTDPAILPYLDLATTTAKLCIDQAEAGKVLEPIDFIAWANYLKDCCHDFNESAKNGFKQSFNFPEIAKGMAQLLDMIGTFDDYDTLTHVDLFCAKYGSFTPEQQYAMNVMLLEHQQYVKFVNDAYVKMWQENFKDGNLRGISRILGNIGGNMGGGYVIGELAQLATAGRLPFAPALNALDRVLIREAQGLPPIFGCKDFICDAEFAVPSEFVQAIETFETIVKDSIRKALPEATDQQIMEATAPVHQALGEALEKMAEKVKPIIEKKVRATEITENIIEDLRGKKTEISKYMDYEKLNREIPQLVDGKMHITHLKRNFKINDLTVQMKTGHSYYRTHLGGGDLRSIGTMNEIEEAIIKDFFANKYFDAIKEGGTMKFDLDYKGIQIQYEPFKKGNFFSFDYYPKKGGL